jgi:hypothetical protein
MTYEEKLTAVLNHLQSIGNDEEEATEILSGLMHDCSMSLPQRGWYSKEYCDLKRKQKNTAIVQLRKLPYGEDIIKTEQNLC